jgi:RNA polymerase sigma-70 factor (ECF subfamily)
MQTNQQRQFVALVQDNRNLIYHFINKYCSDEEYKDDLFQDILLRGWHAYDNFKGESKFSTWIGRIARNTAIDRLRRLSNKAKEISVSNWLFEITDESYSEKPFPVIDSLSETEKQTLFMRIEGLTFAEISERTGEPTSRLLVRMHRIKKQLSKSLSQ